MEVKTLCLGVLNLGAASGYEIKKKFEDSPVGDFMEASYGSIYPALTKLTEEGLVTCEAQAQEGRPDKKVYSITEKGKAAFVSAMSVSPSEDKYRSEFAFMMLFADLLAPHQVSHLIDLQILRYRQKQVEERFQLLPPESRSAQFLEGYGQAVFAAAIKYLEENRHLVEARPNGKTQTAAAATKEAATA